MNSLYSVGITGIGSYVPEKVITNYDLCEIVDTSNEWIVERTGIQERRIVDQSLSTSDIGTIAANKALEDSNTNPKEIDLIIVATATPDMAFPSTACIVQKNIQAINAAAFDISAGCSGFIYGLSIGFNFIKAGTYRKVLVIGGETLSKIVNWEDRNTCVLFGDGAGACILERCEEGFGFLTFDLGSDGNNGHLLIQPAGGSRLPASYETVSNRLHTIKMDGREVFKFAVRIIEKSSKEVLRKANIPLEQIDLLIPHQANMRIIQSAIKKLQLEENKVYINLDKYGNMSSASIPVALDEAYKKEFFSKGDIVLLVAFGAGLTWGATLLRWNK
ncbi:3-oxoacyl-(acyl-carrier-protein) synthase III [[Clostridium] ultunense Esp]|uniref:Beta-ketoacyl-[acyl-carrier-protein] synthase III n=1 Tax=[Clostridium] ultunense Esp TaxID=1288971 RepID=M1Z7K9_9FIRM|nr:beta-ketoacyl-ACP synthase III [Schnuerera ultunensis]CCQ93563.1 3-oxoacyl-(acyl-carrier-protein) synthase III [[Clostridium] ultunense Esp]SHD75505.1 beta-ketoacyl-acyl carrier protein synthase III 1 [[Clostridium] ultunense Esp]